MRDLRGRHVPLLKAIRDAAHTVVEQTYGLTKGSVRLYVHYQPSYCKSIQLSHVCICGGLMKLLWRPFPHTYCACFPERYTGYDCGTGSFTGWYYLDGAEVAFFMCVPWYTDTLSSSLFPLISCLCSRSRTGWDLSMGCTSPWSLHRPTWNRRGTYPYTWYRANEGFVRYICLRSPLATLAMSFIEALIWKDHNTIRKVHIDEQSNGNCQMSVVKHSNAYNIHIVQTFMFKKSKAIDPSASDVSIHNIWHIDVNSATTHLAHVLDLMATDTH